MAGPYRQRVSDRLSATVTVMQPFRAAGRQYIEGQEVVWRRRSWNPYRVRVMIRRGDVFNGDLEEYVNFLGPEESLLRGFRDETFDEFEARMEKDLEELQEQSDESEVPDEEEDEDLEEEDEDLEEEDEDLEEEDEDQ